MSRRILVIDDHVAVRRGLVEILSAALQDAVFSEADSAERALEQVRGVHFEIAILDLNLPGRGGLDLIRSLKDEQPKMGILVYSMHSEREFGMRALRAGADGYLSKDRPPEEVAAAVLKILGGEHYIGPGLAELLARSVSGHAPRSHEALSDREYQVFEGIANGKTVTEMARDLGLSVKTVSTYRTRVLEKLELESTADLVRYAVEHRIG